ncbi:AAA family ATPase [Desulfobacula sp.]|uniref:ATP-binding protein n=1 Tax=Desulfobacula sp. TaxID=2593537 RepID=UPI0025C212DF|nr:AAA family ATPase [Desulfobacula sp.]MBC2703481.1 AAA family ATPase [Desulfobacula sp.]
MKNYIRRVRVTDLFDQQNDLVIDFDQSINCIFGVNGTGKTVLINLIVNALFINSQDLFKTPFSSISILTAPDGKKQPEKFLNVSFDGHKINYLFFKRFEIKLDTPKIHYVVEANKNYSITNESPQALYGPEKEMLPKWILQYFIDQHVSLTYVPLWRHSTSSGLLGDVLDTQWQSSDKKDDSFPDPTIKVLEILQLDFSRQYASAQSEIARQLESLSSVIFEKLLLDKTIVGRSTSAATSIVYKVLNERGIEEKDLKVDSVIAQITDLNLNIPEWKIRESQKAWTDLKLRLIESKANLGGLNKDSDAKKYDDANAEYTSAYFNLLASARINMRFQEAIREIQNVHTQKQRIMNPFDKFKYEINNFLANNKTFTFNDSGEFEFYHNRRKIGISKLSSGEKHLFAILGKVCFSPSDISTFIADEPELSLHLEWQREILSSIRRLSPNTQVIVATHAPAIIAMKSNKIDIEKCYTNA